jgi:uncharacterized peroxidase-related enzyme
MSRIELIDPKQTDETREALLQGIERKLGRVPNMMRGMAQSPAALNIYLTMGNLLDGGVLTAQQREQIALRTAELNGCHYCLGAHCAIGKMVGLNEDTLRESRKGNAEDAETAAMLELVEAIITTRGEVRDETLDRVRAAGLDDQTVTEVLAAVVLNIFTNYFNQLADTPMDFPVAEPLAADACGCQV